MKIPATFNDATSSNGVLRTLSNLFRSNIREYGMLIALIAVMVFFQFQTGGILFKPVNITNLVLQNSYVITMALGMLLIIVSGWIDLSVGSVVAVVGAKPEARITLTYPALESSRHAAFLVAGDEKRAIFRRLRDGDNCLPAARLRPIAGVTWFLDRAAAGTET